MSKASPEIPKLEHGQHLHNTWESHQGYHTWADTKQKKQWVEEKLKNPDHIIFTHVGKFFEFFHEDADVLHQTCSTPYMKGEVAHTGIPQTVFLSVQEKLKNAGHDKISIIYYRI